VRLWGFCASARLLGLGAAARCTVRAGAVHCSGERLAYVHCLWWRAAATWSWAGGQGWARLA